MRAYIRAQRGVVEPEARRPRRGAQLVQLDPQVRVLDRQVDHAVGQPARAPAARSRSRATEDPAHARRGRVDQAADEAGAARVGEHVVQVVQDDRRRQPGEVLARPGQRPDLAAGLPQARRRRGGRGGQRGRDGRERGAEAAQELARRARARRCR